MSGSLDDCPPQAIVLTGSAESERPSLPVGHMDFRLDLGDVRDANELVRVLADELMFPHEASGFDALLDLMSDLDWFGNDAGYVVDLRDLDQLDEHAPDVLARFVALLPNLCDRWRSRGVPFRLILRCHGTTKQTVRSVLDTANAELQEASHRPWLADVAPAEVVEFVD